MGSFLAAYEYFFSWPVLLLAFITALQLQVLSNLGNDYGDFISGTDQAAGRTDRALASGNISPVKMKKALWLISITTLFSGLILLWISFRSADMRFVLWLLIGLLSIAAALNYTIGKFAYGYRGLGDIFVLLFFGPVSVGGSYFLMSHQLNLNILVPSFAFGLLCVAVLNINNLRDIQHDLASGKRTMVVILGYRNGIIYQYALVASALLLMILFARVTQTPYDHFLIILFGLIYYWITRSLEKEISERMIYNKALKRVSLTNLFFVVLLGYLWLLS